MKCQSCDAPARHIEPFYDGYREWCEEHVPWSGHYEHCGESCTQLSLINTQDVPDPARLYPDGWPVRADDALAQAIYDAICRDDSTPFETLSESQRDDYRSAAAAARDFLVSEGRRS